MVGSAIAVIMVTEAPMMPVMAARMVPITVTDIASPPGTLRNRIWVMCNRSSAIPLRSIVIPITIKVGKATSTRFSAANPQILGAKLKNSPSEKTPSENPIRPKEIDTPPRMNATG